MPSTPHTHAHTHSFTSDSLIFFLFAIRTSDSFIFVRTDRIHFTLLQSRNKSHVCGVGACVRAVVFGFLLPLNDLSCCVVRCSQYGTHTNKTQMLNEIREMPKAPAPNSIFSPLVFLATCISVAVTCKHRVKRWKRRRSGGEKGNEDKKGSIGFRVFDGAYMLDSVDVVAVDLFSPDEIDEWFTIGPNKKCVGHRHNRWKSGLSILFSKIFEVVPCPPHSHAVCPAWATRHQFSVAAGYYVAASASSQNSDLFLDEMKLKNTRQRTYDTLLPHRNSKHKSCNRLAINKLRRNRMDGRPHSLLIFGRANAQSNYYILAFAIDRTMFNN